MQQYVSAVVDTVLEQAFCLQFDENILNCISEIVDE